MKARYSLPLALKDLKYNSESELYEATEEGVTFKLTFDQMNDLKKFYAGSLNIIPTFLLWYQSLNNNRRKKVIVENLKVNKNIDFYPDVEYD